MALATDDEVLARVTPVLPAFNSFAILDLETTNLPAFNFNKVAITELCVYGVSLQEFLATKPATETCIPQTPRVLHKLTLLFNPRLMVHPESEAITGLNNYMLEHESSFDENAANTFLCFLAHLQHPICLVSHNGWNFDFPIVKQALDKLKKILPSILCMDSLFAFQKIDEQRAINTQTSSETCPKENSQFDWRAYNETTPKRPTTKNATEVIIKRRRHLNLTNDKTENDVTKPTTSSSTLKTRRTLFSKEAALPSTQNHSFKKYYPRKGIYKLDQMFERIFKRKPKQAHYAEADVAILLKLMQFYGPEFVQYAKEYAIPFEEVKKVGA